MVSGLVPLSFDLIVREKCVNCTTKRNYIWDKNCYF